MSDSKPDAYTLAVIANFAADYGKDREFTRRAMQALARRAHRKGRPGLVDSEETASTPPAKRRHRDHRARRAGAAQVGAGLRTARKALAFISSKKEAIRHLGHHAGHHHGAARAAARFTARVRPTCAARSRSSLNGKPVETLKLTPENNDLLHQFVFKGIDTQQANIVQLRFDGHGRSGLPGGRALLPAVGGETRQRAALHRRSVRPHPPGAGRHRHGHRDRPQQPAQDRQHGDGRSRHSAGLRSAERRPAGYPGEDCGNATGHLEKFSLTATQAILYFNALAPGQTVTLKVRLRAKYPIRARTFQSRVYEYYDPDVNSIARAVQLEVARH